MPPTLRRSASRRLLPMLLATVGAALLAVLSTTAADAACHRSECTAHYRATITAKVTTRWDLPKQSDGGGSCYRSPYVVGHGAQTLTAHGKGLVQFKRPGRLIDVTYLRGRRGKLGLGRGTSKVVRSASMIHGDDPGPCGSNGDPHREEATGCGARKQPATFTLAFVKRNAMAFDVLSTFSYSGCPLYSTGLTPALTSLHGWSEHDFLSKQIHARVSQAKLLSGKLRKVVLRGKRTFTRSGGYGYDVPPKSVTTVSWKVTLKRVHHADFFGL